jgi:group I intron endonuclease
MMGIYGWVNLKNCKVYVGSARHVSKRKTAHLRALKAGKHHSTHLQAAWDLYGEEAFEFLILEPIEDEIWLRVRETAWIQRLQSCNPEFGYNICRDGWSGAQYEPTERRKAAWRRNGERKQGKKDSPETCARKKAAAIKRVASGKGIPSHLGHHHSDRDRTNMRKAWVDRKARGDYYKFTPEDSIKGVTTAGAKNKLLWQDPVYRENQVRKNKASWTPERRAAQAERARNQALANPINQRRGTTGTACVVEVRDE